MGLKEFNEECEKEAARITNTKYIPPKIPKQTHTSYAVSKRLKEFLGDSAPEPMGDDYWGKPTDWDGAPVITKRDDRKSIEWTAAYRLEDLLSKPFCEAMAKEDFVEDRKRFGSRRAEIADVLFRAYFNGGLPAVEKTLMDMMEGK